MVLVCSSSLSFTTSAFAAVRLARMVSQSEENFLWLGVRKNRANAAALVEQFPKQCQVIEIDDVEYRKPPFLERKVVVCDEL